MVKSQVIGDAYKYIPQTVFVDTLFWNVVDEQILFIKPIRNIIIERIKLILIDNDRQLRDKEGTDKQFTMSHGEFIQNSSITYLEKWNKLCRNKFRNNYVYISSDIENHIDQLILFVLNPIEYGTRSERWTVYVYEKHGCDSWNKCGRHALYRPARGWNDVYTSLQHLLCSIEWYIRDMCLEEKSIQMVLSTINWYIA